MLLQLARFHTGKTHYVRRLEKCLRILKRGERLDCSFHYAGHLQTRAVSDVALQRCPKEQFFGNENTTNVVCMRMVSALIINNIDL